MKLLITGATGFIGTALVQHLSADASCSVRAAVRQADAVLPRGVDRLVLPALGPQVQWQQALEGCDVVVHLAARVHIMQERSGNPLSQYRHTNVLGTMNLAQQAAQSGVRRFVYMSSVKVNGESTQAGVPFHPDDPPNPRDPYAMSKREAEGELQLMRAGGSPQTSNASDMELVIIRPPLVYGPAAQGNFLSLARAVRKGLPLPLGAVRNQRSFVALDNLVDFIDLCCRHPSAADQTFLVSDGCDLSTADLVRRIGSTMGRQARLFSVPPVWLQRIAAFFGKGAEAQRLCCNLELDISKARDLLGWTPPVTVDEGLRRALVNFR